MIILPGTEAAGTRESNDVQLRMSGLGKTEELVALPVDAAIEMRLNDNDLNVSIGPRSMVAMRIHR